jgi:hypothetical protein
MSTLTRSLAQKFAALTLDHIQREYPHKLDHVMTDDTDGGGPQTLHPIFFGSFDWHSCVHGYWLLARLVRRFPDLPAAPRISKLFREAITPQKVAIECAYLARPSSRGFERPYGWAWLLALQAELDRHHTETGSAAAQSLRPLTQAFAERFKAFLPLCDYPVRAGSHSSTAFALRLAVDYAQSQDSALFALLRDKAANWYHGDRDAQAWEPSQDDFLSPTLIEAECMRCVLKTPDFVAWFADFLPKAAIGEPATLFTPPRISDRSDGKIAHLDGLNFSRAWCWRGIAGVHPTDSELAARALDAAQRHIDASLAHVAGDYMGEHWLATFASLALDPL